MLVVVCCQQHKLAAPVVLHLLMVTVWGVLSRWPSVLVALQHLPAPRGMLKL
jgi:hypothetical protein